MIMVALRATRAAWSCRFAACQASMTRMCARLEVRTGLFAHTYPTCCPLVRFSHIEDAARVALTRALRARRARPQSGFAAACAACVSTWLGELRARRRAMRACSNAHTCICRALSASEMQSCWLDNIYQDYYVCCIVFHFSLDQLFG